MKILLLGASGQLGTDIIKYQQKFAETIILQAVTRQQFDISHVNKINEFLDAQDFDILINCTGYTQVDKAEIEIDSAFLINAFAVEKIAEVCEQKQAKLIHMSTDYIFGGNSNNQPLNEQTSHAPLNIYGKSKLLGEELALSTCSNTIILRTASLFGINPSKTKGNFVETIIKYGKEKGSLRVVQDQFMSPTGTADLARMIFKAIQAEIAPGIYHAVNSGQASWYEFANSIIEQAKIDCIIQPIAATEYPLPAKRPAYSVLDNTKLSQLIGTIPHWRKSLASYFKFRASL